MESTKRNFSIPFVEERLDIRALDETRVNLSVCRYIMPMIKGLIDSEQPMNEGFVRNGADT